MRIRAAEAEARRGALAIPGRATADHAGAIVVAGAQPPESVQPGTANVRAHGAGKTALRGAGRDERALAEIERIAHGAF